jgi:hypothetical protein
LVSLRKAVNSLSGGAAKLTPGKTPNSNRKERNKIEL